MIINGRPEYIKEITLESRDLKILRAHVGLLSSDVTNYFLKIISM